MLHLLLSQDRHKIRREYHFRFLNMFLIFTLILCFVTGLLIFPTHVHVFIEKGFSERQFMQFQSSAVIAEQKELEKLRGELQEKFSLVENHTFYSTNLIAKILARKPDGIFLNSFIVREGEVKDGESYVTAELRGIANNRELLVLFSGKLKEDDYFESVDLPLSSLTKESDIPFSVFVKVKASKTKI